MKRLVGKEFLVFGGGMLGENQSNQTAKRSIFLNETIF